MKKSEPLPVVLIDRREQLPWRFPGLETELVTLPEGDYSCRGLTGRLAVERKSLSDWVGSLTTGRDRFEAEMDRLKGYERACIIVEAHLDDVMAGLYRSATRPSSIVGSMGSIWARWGVPTLYAGTRDNAEVVARAILVKAAKYLRQDTEAA